MAAWHPDCGWTIRRRFDWANHRNDCWDEVLDVWYDDALLFGSMMVRFGEFGQECWQDAATCSVADGTAAAQPEAGF